MSCGDIRNGDVLFRHAFQPVAFKGQKFAIEKFWRLSVDQRGALLTSLAWQKYVPEVRDVHNHGCRMASRRNAAAKAAKKYSEKSRSVYCGAYAILASSIRRLPGQHNLAEVVSAHVLHHPEEGEIAHADLVVVLDASRVTDIEATKTAIIARLWMMSSGPLKHECADDTDLDEHPNSLLENAPRGLYRDLRSRLTQAWHRVRCRLCSGIMRRWVRA